MTNPANVNKHLHDPGDVRDQESDSPKRALRGAAGGNYVGPARINSADSNTAHATGSAAGGVEDSTGYRKRDKYEPDGGGSLASNTRPTGRTAYVGDGVQGGSTPGRPIASGTDHLNTGAFDKRSTIVGDGGRSVEASGRGTSYRVGTADPLGTGVTAGAVKNPRFGTATPIIPRPEVGTSANPAAGTVALVQAALALQADLHADDITGGANGIAGCELFLFTRGTDTDNDGTLVGKVDFDSTTLADAFTGLAAATTYAFYARFKDTAGNIGPLSARGTVATS